MMLQSRVQEQSSYSYINHTNSTNGNSNESNKSNGKDLYNEPFKLRFLNGYAENTKAYYYYVFQRASRIERKLGKDIHDFNKEELDMLMKTFSSSSVDSIRGMTTVLRNYISFSITNGYSETGINYLQTIDQYEQYKRYLNLNTIKNKFITETELKALCNECYNAQDALCFALPFYGIRGEANSEITNLKVEHVGFISNTIKIIKDGVLKKTVKVDSFLINLISDAIKEDEYFKENGNVENNRPYVIPNNDYVIRTWAKYNNEPSGSMIVNARIRRIGMILGNNRLSPLALWYSGMYKNYSEIKLANGKVTKEDVLYICYVFGYNSEYWTRINKKMKEIESICND